MCTCGPTEATAAGELGPFHHMFATVKWAAGVVWLVLVILLRAHTRRQFAIAAECCRALAATKRLLDPFGLSATACRASLSAMACEPRREWQFARYRCSTSHRLLTSRLWLRLAMQSANLRSAHASLAPCFATWCCLTARWRAFSRIRPSSMLFSTALFSLSSPASSRLLQRDVSLRPTGLAKASTTCSTAIDALLWC